MLSPNAPAAKKTKYLAKFQNACKSEFKWCQASSKGPDFAYCTTCKTDFKVCYGGRNDLTKHMETNTHKQKHTSVSSTPTSMLSSTTSIDKVTYAETLFANYVAEHKCAFLVADHFSDLVKAMFPDSNIAQKFSCMRSKNLQISSCNIATRCCKRYETSNNRLISTLYRLLWQ